MFWLIFRNFVDLCMKVNIFELKDREINKFLDGIIDMFYNYLFFIKEIGSIELFMVFNFLISLSF